MRKWPKPQSKSTKQKNALQIDWFRQATHLCKYVDPRTQVTMRLATEGTPLMPRDLLLSLMAGRIFAIDLDDGRTLYPMSAIKDVQAAIEVLGQRVGETLVRGPDGWQSSGTAPEGHVLTSQGENAAPIWQPGGGTGSGFQPPTFDDFPLNINAQNGEWAGALSGGIALASNSAYGNSNLRAFGRPLSTPPRSYLCGVYSFCQPSDYALTGIGLWDDTNNEAILYGTHHTDDAAYISVAGYKHSSVNSNPGVFANESSTHRGRIFYLIHDDGTHLTFWTGVSGVFWHLTRTELKSDLLAAPSHVILGVSVATNYGRNIEADFFHYAEQA
jgi:hypothetical protein